MPKRIVVDIEGIEAKIELNSKTVATEEFKIQFQNAVNNLLSEIVLDEFELVANITEKNTFNISIGAIETSELKRYQLNVDVGLFKWLYDGLYIVLSNNAIFHGMGLSHSKFEIPSIEVPNWDTLDLAMANNDPVYFSAKRFMLHDFLFNLSISFIIRHELRHIANGHIDYLKNKNIHMFYENAKNGLNYLDSQTLEMDVDSCVTAGMLAGLLYNSQQRDEVPEEMRDERGIFMSILFTLQFLFYCMPSRKVANLSEAKSGSHPNAYLRFFYCFTTGISYLTDTCEENVSVFGEIYKYEFLNFFDYIPGFNKNTLGKVMTDYEWSLSEEGQAYANEVWNNWNNLRPEIEKFAYLKLAPLEKD